MKSETIIIKTSEGYIEKSGNCITSKLVWSRNVEEAYHINNGVFSTKQVPTDYFEEVWNIEGKEIKLAKFVKMLKTKTTTEYWLD